MEYLIVLLIIAAAGWYVFRTFAKGMKKEDGGHCGCASCPSGSECGGEIRELTKDK